MAEYPEGQEWILEMINNILIEVLSTIAEQERLTIHTRQAEGIAAMTIKNGKHYSEKKGTYYGRSPLSEDIIKSINNGVPYQELGISRSSYYKYKER